MINVDNWNWAVWTYLAITFIGLLFCANMHGKKKMGYHNFWSDIFATLVIFSLLTFGGFFK